MMFMLKMTEFGISTIQSMDLALNGFHASNFQRFKHYSYCISDFFIYNNPRISELDQPICDCLCNLVASCAHQNEDITKI